MAGRPPKPVEQKRRAGNPGKRPLPSRTSLAVVPAVARPQAMSLGALDAFELVMERGVHWLGETDLPTLVLLRQVLEKRDQVEHTDLKLWIELTKTAHGLLAQCGFDPASRSKLGLAEVTAKSKLEKLRERRDRNSPEVGVEDDGG